MVRPRTAALFSIAVLVALLVHNVYAAVQHEIRDRSLSHRVLPRKLSAVAARSSTPKATRYAVYYWLHDHLRGATLAVPPWLEGQISTMNASTKMKVVLGEERPLSTEQADQLRPKSSKELRYLLDNKRRKNRRYADVYMVVEPAVRDYLVAEGPPRNKQRQLFVMPASRYADLTRQAAKSAVP